KTLQDEFFGILQGKKADRHGWLTLVKQPVAAAR
ncbi:MAG: branched chain amino acid aminotransferase, partial [Acidobacteria bacterium]|nr:branched chain amino acid aminotransferase [Acidobacteriota bacterium]